MPKKTTFSIIPVGSKFRLNETGKVWTKVGIPDRFIPDRFVEFFGLPEGEAKLWILAGDYEVFLIEEGN